MSSGRKLLLTWLALVIITIAAFLIGEVRSSGFLVPTLISAAALVKGGLIVTNFMEIRRRDHLWHRLYFAWLIAMAGLLLSSAL